MACIFAVAYNEAGRRQEALQLTEKIVEARKMMLGEAHPDILRQIHDLRTLERKLGSGQCRLWSNSIRIGNISAYSYSQVVQLIV